MHALLKQLEGGDRRSIGRVCEVVEDVRNDPSLFSVLIEGLFLDDPILRMRSADATEKITADHPEYLQPFKQKLIHLSGHTTQQEVKWHLAQITPRLELEPNEKKTIVKNLFTYLNDKSKIVVTFALQALSDFAVEDENLRAPVSGRDPLGGSDDDFEIEVAVEVGGGHAAYLGRVATGGGVGRPTVLDGQLAADPLPGEDLVRSGRHHLDNTVTIEVCDHVWSVDPTLLIGCPVEERAGRVENEDVVVGRDDLV